jgi:hypothetical protein
MSNPKLSDDQITEIAEAHKAGRSLESLAAEYDVTRRIIAKRLKRRGLFIRDSRDAVRLWRAKHSDASREQTQDTAAHSSGMKVCASCKAVRPQTDYAESKVTKGRAVSFCSVCQAKRLRYRQRLRAEMIRAYGGRCACCGEETPEFLGIDHVYNDGAQERREGKSSGFQFYAWLRTRGYPKDGYQLLCHNCNLAKGTYGECPHEAARRAAA